MNGRIFHPRWGKTIIGRFVEAPHIRILEVLPKPPINWDQVKELGKNHPRAIGIGVKTGTSTASATDNPHYKEGAEC